MDHNNTTNTSRMHNDNDNNVNHRYIFWLNDIHILYKNNNYLSFLPMTEMTRVEQLNALSRLCIYYTLLIFLFEYNTEYYYFSIILFLFIIVVYYLYKADITGKHSEIQRNFKNEEFQPNTIYTDDGLPENLLPGSDDPLKEQSIDIESGYLDSDNKMHVGPYYSNKTPSRSSHSKIPLDELIKYEKKTCRQPSQDNPFMNPLTTHFNNGDQPSACNADDDTIKDRIDADFNMDLFRDVDDLFNVKNSQRQFYTMPNTQIPNDQTAFANWCYGNSPACKENQEQCLKYEDIRYESRTHY
jgi:hypothetical protein